MSKLFEEFESISATQWKQKIQVDLKGADYNETLITATPEGIDIKPFYHRDTTENTIPVATKTTQWKIAQHIKVTNEEEANAQIKAAFENGVESIVLEIPEAKFDISKILKNTSLNDKPIYIQCNFLSATYVKHMFAFAKEHKAKIHLNCDIIGNLAKSGNWFTNLKEDHQQLEEILKTSTLETTIAVSVDTYQNAGATIVQQLAYALSHANEYLNHFGKDIGNITFHVSVGSHYFFEIAKLRALRLLWKTLAAEYDADETCHIIAFPSQRNKTLYDYNVNMLRTTTECMSAVLGGADIIYNIPYDDLYHESNEFGERIAKNQLRILKDESYFDKTDNPTDGAYYIESLTSQLAEKALTLFKDIEANGGFLHQLKAGTIQRKIKESAEKEQIAFDNGKEILVGTNKYPNASDRMKQELQKDPFSQKNVRKVLLQPITPKRLAEKLEKERLNNE